MSADYMTNKRERLGPTHVRAPKRVLFVEANEDGTVGGSHQVLLDMVTHFDRTLVEPVVMFYENNRFADRMEEAGIETIRWDDVRKAERQAQVSRGVAGKALALGQAVLRRQSFIRDHRIDLVHMNNSPRTGRDDWLPAARLSRVPIVASARGDANPLPGAGLRAAIHRALMRRFDRVLAVSEYIADAWRAQGVSAERVQVVHDGVNRKKLDLLGKRTTAEVRDSLHVPSDRVFVAMVGNIREWKGQHVVIEALGAMPPEERRKLFVSFIGLKRPEDGGYFERLESLVEAFGLGDVVSFPGSRTDVPEIMANADIVVHSSVKPEPGGTVVIEAMTFGAPVVVASRGGHLDYLKPGLGLVHDVDSPGQLAEHLVTLANDPDLRAEMVAKSKQRAAEFSIDHTSRKMERVYWELLAG